MTVKELVDNAVDACRHAQNEGSTTPPRIPGKRANVATIEAPRRIAVRILSDPNDMLRNDNARPETLVEVQVDDNGTGISETTIEHLGTLFGTSKTPWGESAAIPTSVDAMRRRITAHQLPPSGPSSPASPTSWLQHKNQEETLDDVQSVLESKPNIVPSGKFGLGLKMVLLASTRGGSGTLRFTVRVSQTSVARFTLKMLDPEKAAVVVVSDLKYTCCSLEEWPWMTSVVTEVPHTDVVDERLTSYFDLVALWNPQIFLTWEYEITSLYGDNNGELGIPTTYQSWFGIMRPPSLTGDNIWDIAIQEKNKSLVRRVAPHLDSSCLNDDEDQNLKLSQQNNIMPRGIALTQWNSENSRLDTLEFQVANKLTSLYHVVLSHTTVSCTAISLSLFLTRNTLPSANCQTHPTMSSSDEKHGPRGLCAGERITIWWWRSCNRVPLPPVDGPVCLISKAIAQFYLSHGDEYGLLARSIGRFQSVDMSMLGPNSTFFSMACQMEGYRVPLATWTDLLVIINVDAEDVEFGSLTKSFLRGPEALTTSIVDALRQGFTTLRHQCGEMSHELISVRRSQYQDAFLNYAPSLSRSLGSLISHSRNTDFKKRVAQALADAEKAYNVSHKSLSDLTAEGRENDTEDGFQTTLEHRLLTLIRHRLETEEANTRPKRRAKRVPPRVSRTSFSSLD